MPEPFGELDAVRELIASDAMDRLAGELVRVALSEADLVATVLMYQYHGLPVPQREREATVEARRFKAAGRRDPSVVHRSLELLTLVEGLSVPQRERLAAALFRVHEQRDENLRDVGPPVRYPLELLALVCDLPDSASLAVTRRRMLESMDRQSQAWQSWYRDMAQIEIDAGRPLPPAVVAVIRRSALYRRHHPWAELARQLTDPVLNVGEAWADQALADLPLLPSPGRDLLAHAVTAAGARPNAAWEKAGRALISAVGAQDARTTMVSWLALAARPRTLPLKQSADHGNDVYDPYNAEALRGLAWLLSFLPPHPDVARALGALVETSLRRVTGLGPRNPKVANAGVFALSRIDGEAALAELARLATRLTYKGTLRLVDAALQAQAQAMGLGREEVEELSIPAYGLTEVGRATREFGAAGTGELLVRGRRAALTWRSGAGKISKSVPAAIRQEHPEALKDLKAAAGDIDKMLPALTQRLDRQFAARRTWTYAAWRERYLDHPLVGTIARRLLWVIDGEACGFADGELRTAAGAPVTGGTTVELWHPSGRELAEVLAWRDWLERHRITQPFKQAHREVYLLTDAERDTGTYSNRFAGHILRQHQFHSLTAIRGWRNKLRLMVDGTFPPATRELPQWGLRAEFWIEGTGDDVSVDIAPSGSYLRLGTDQVRFYPIGAPENVAHDASRRAGGYYMLAGRGHDPVQPVPLTEIPALVLSEVLRDVDLFVGVASLGNDPTWQDGGPNGRFARYWISYGFSELNEAAQTRRDLLARLLPRLAIAGQCTIESRFLHVKGTRHSYKIHLGSGNVLITPGDRYLCIVPRPDAGPDLGYLPFEGDLTLSVIVSKAMLLARDERITDPAILRQL
jgi:Domain of unknown function (DUF4132)